MKFIIVRKGQILTSVNHGISGEIFEEFPAFPRSEIFYPTLPCTHWSKGEVQEREKCIVWFGTGEYWPWLACGLEWLVTVTSFSCPVTAQSATGKLGPVLTCTKPNHALFPFLYLPFAPVSTDSE